MNHSASNLARRLQPSLLFIFSSLLLLSVCRLVLILWLNSRLGWAGIAGVFVTGLRMDAILVGYIAVIPTLLLLATPHRGDGLLTGLLKVWFSAWLLIFLVMEAAGVGFLREYDHRPDQLFWEYLSYPGEVVPMLLKGFQAELLLGTVALCVGLWAVVRWQRRYVKAPKQIHVLLRLVAAPLVIIVFGLMIRSSLDHRPANISTAIFSDNRIANELALNSTYSAAYALYANRLEVRSSDLYGSMPVADAVALVRQDMGVPSEALYADHPTVRHIEPSQPLAKPRNLVIILEESLGAQFSERLGGLPLTPNLDRLGDRGLWFTNMFATGTRTVRGLEAVIASFPPSTARSVVKRNKSRRDFNTVADTLQRVGYETMFIYGGNPHFDDMASFMSGNGFERLIDLDDFSDPHFVGSWGVSDEDLMENAHQLFANHDEQPFMAVMLSTSNHTPWEFPADSIEPYEQPLATRNNSVKYSDHAIGRFFQLAENSDYYNNTVFVVIADHDARVFGDEMIPIEHFRIPALIIAPGLQPQEINQVASQLDILPTVLPMLGISTETAAVGRNLLSPDAPPTGRALLQYGQNFGYLAGDQLSILLPNGSVKQFHYRKGQALTPTKVDPNAAATALAYPILSEWLYDNRRYQLTAPSEAKLP